MAYVSITVFDRKSFSNHATLSAGSLSAGSQHPPTRNPDGPPSIC